MTWKPDVCFYHFPCDDGFASAWIVRKKWPDVALFGTNYGLPLPTVDLTGKHLLIADFSYKPDVLAKLGNLAASIVILDHHKTAEADLADFKVGVSPSAKFAAADMEGMFRDLAEIDRPPIVARFEMDRSGASLTWEFCFPDEPMPALIAHVEDRDLWRMALQNTRSISLLLRSYPYDFTVWDDLAKTLESHPALVVTEARGIERFFDRKLAEIIPTATLKDIGKWKGVPVAHAPYAFASDLAHELLKEYPTAPFAAVVVDAYGARTYSLRSEDSREDVSEVAKSFGGGGHRNAAGFRVPA